MDTSYSYNVNGAAAVIWTLFVIAFYVLVVIGLWKTFVKAGHPGWAAIIPFYNIYIWVKIAGRPTSWFWIMLVGVLLSWIPILGWLLLIAVWIMSLFLALDVAKNFGQGTGFGILLWLFSGIMYLVLGFGNYEYRQVAHPEMATAGGGGYAPPPPPPPAQPAQPGIAAPLAPPPPLTPPPAPAVAPPAPEPPVATSPEPEPQVAAAPTPEPPAATAPTPEPPVAPPEPPVAPPEPPVVPPAPPTT